MEVIAIGTGIIGGAAAAALLTIKLKGTGFCMP